MAVTDSIRAIGRRKTSVARLTMNPGSGNIAVNGRSYDDYFPTVSLQNHLLVPVQTAQAQNKFDFNIRVGGGGLNGQVGAIRLAIARALAHDNPEIRPTLKAAGLLRRDPRMKERKKAGQPGARKRFQFSKR